MGKQTTEKLKQRREVKRDTRSLKQLIEAAMSPEAMAVPLTPDTDGKTAGLRVLAIFVKHAILDEGEAGQAMRHVATKLLDKNDPLRAMVPDNVWPNLWPIVNQLQHARAGYLETLHAQVKAQHERETKEREEASRAPVPEAPGPGEPPGPGVLRVDSPEVQEGGQ